MNPRRRLRAALGLALGLPLVGYAVAWRAVDDDAPTLDATIAAGCAGRWDVAVVPSGDPDERRTHGAAALLRAGCVRTAFFTGRGAGGDDAATLAAVARSDGVAPDVIVVDLTAESTRENATAFAAWAAPGARVVVLTERRHARRVRGAFEAVGVSSDVRLVGDAALEPGRAREALKLALYALVGWWR